MIEQEPAPIMITFYSLRIQRQSWQMVASHEFKQVINPQTHTQSIDEKSIVFVFVLQGIIPHGLQRHLYF